MLELQINEKLIFVATMRICHTKHQQGFEITFSNREMRNF